MKKQEFLKTMDYRDEMSSRQIDFRGLHSISIPHWPVASASTVFLWSKILDKAQAAFIQSEFQRKNREYKPFAKEAAPYFNVARGIWNGSSKFDASCRKMGYEWLRSYRQIVFKNPRKFEIPKNFELQITEKLSRQDQSALVCLHQQGFGLSKKIWLQNCLSFAKTASNIQFHNLWSPKGRLVGTGAIVYGKSSALAFSGVIDEKFRGKGLWNVILSSRVNMALAHGVDSIVMKTVHPLLINKGDHNVLVDIFMKK
jgi:hypothetical protein